MRLNVSARASTNRSPEHVFDSLSGPSGLDWIETPWAPRTVAGLEDGTALIWTLGGQRTAQTRVRARRPDLIEWTGDGVEGRITIDARESKTEVRWSGTFPLTGRSPTDLMVGLVMRGRMSRMASDESQSRLARRIR